MKVRSQGARIAAVSFVAVLLSISAGCKCAQPEIDKDGMDPVSGPIEGGTEVTFSGGKLKGSVEVVFEKEGVEYPAAIESKKKKTLVVWSPAVPEAGVADVTIYKCRDKSKKRKEVYAGEFTYFNAGNPDPLSDRVIEANMGGGTLAGSVLVEVGHVIDADFRDVVAVGTDQVIVLKGDGTGALDAVREIAILGSPTDLVVSDFDGDGADDAAVTLGDKNRVVVLLNDAGAGLHADRLRSYEVGTNPIAIEAVDMNRDGQLDLVVANRGSGDLSILTNSGSGSFTLEATRRVPPPIPRESTVPPSPTADVLAIAAGDFDGDGHHDLAVGTDIPGAGGALAAAPRIELLRNTSSPGAFASTWHPTPMEIGEPILALAASDFSHAARTDLAVLSAARIVFAEPFEGTETHRTDIVASRPAAAIRAGDFFSKSESDVVVTFTHPVVDVLPAPLHRRSDGERIDVTDLAVPTWIAAGVLAEADGTTAFDLVIAGGGTIFVVLNDGSGFD